MFVGFICLVIKYAYLLSLNHTEQVIQESGFPRNACSVEGFNMWFCNCTMSIFQSTNTGRLFRTFSKTSIAKDSNINCRSSSAAYWFACSFNTGPLHRLWRQRTSTSFDLPSSGGLEGMLFPHPLRKLVMAGTRCKLSIVGSSTTDWTRQVGFPISK